MAGVVWGTSGEVAPMMEGDMGTKISGLLILIVSGIGSYLMMIFATGALKPKELKALLKRKKST
ncbi:MAG: hypothetical protein JKY45_09225 [Emcibacter sp.]|nr:hypothetical protein [Emcibacter sp.]